MEKTRIMDAYLGRSMTVRQKNMGPVCERKYANDGIEKTECKVSQNDGPLGGSSMACIARACTK